MNTVAIVQARMTSTRLPGKVLKPLAGKVVLEHVLSRLSRCQLIDKIVVATTTDDDDDTLVDWCGQYGVSCFRGDRDNVLSRFHSCALQLDADEIVRVTSDNPLVDSSIVDQTIRLRRTEKADYAANNLVKTFPHGLDVEVITFKALEESHLEAVENYEREHVTQFVRHREKRYKLVNLSSGEDWHDIRVTLDEDEDKQLIELVMRLSGIDVDFIGLQALFSEFPSLKRINARSKNWHAKYNLREHII
ncbi:MAG: glycosyltransferase family protein [Desulfobulbaceae bacterium]|nr:glycosyltransferase family protein [Desulfobulbaceae bacterium]